ncbi:MAG: sortase [Candidatus Saccharimonadales bacterium]|nr:sortase [Candidatus Saccharimonadales bacterium]
MDPNQIPPQQNPYADPVQPQPPVQPAPQQPANVHAEQMVRHQVQQMYQQQPQPAPQQPPAYQPYQPPPPSPPSEQQIAPHLPTPAPTPGSSLQYETFALPGQPSAGQQNAVYHPQSHSQHSVQAAVSREAESVFDAYSQQNTTTHQAIPNATNQPSTVGDLKDQIINRVNMDKEKRQSRTKPLIVAIIVAVLFLGVSYNEIAIAQIRQYISPGSSVSTPIILDPSQDVKVGKESKIIIPKINVDVPVVYDVTSYDEAEIQAALERGVVHYGQTALPGEVGNNVIVGHSSNNFFNSGKYKFAFVLLDRLEEGDTFILHYRGTRYIYRVYNKEVIQPDDFSAIEPTDQPTTTLITCTPPGTSWRRLIIQGEQISPNPSKAKEVKSEIPQNIETPVPGNAPSFWQRVRDAIF